MSVPVTVAPPMAQRRHVRRLLALTVAVLAVVAGVALSVLLFTGTGGGAGEVDDVNGVYPGPGSQLDQCLNTVGRSHC